MGKGCRGELGNSCLAPPAATGLREVMAGLAGAVHLQQRTIHMVIADFESAQAGMEREEDTGGDTCSTKSELASNDQTPGRC